jgi:hypothetical protein
MRLREDGKGEQGLSMRRDASRKKSGVPLSTFFSTAVPNAEVCILFVGVCRYFPPGKRACQVGG